MFSNCKFIKIKNNSLHSKYFVNIHLLNLLKKQDHIKSINGSYYKGKYCNFQLFSSVFQFFLVLQCLCFTNCKSLSLVFGNELGESITYVNVVIKEPMKSQVQFVHNDNAHAYHPRKHPTSDFHLNSSHKQIRSEDEKEKEHNGYGSPDVDRCKRGYQKFTSSNIILKTIEYKSI